MFDQTAVTSQHNVVEMQEPSFGNVQEPVYDEISEPSYENHELDDSGVSNDTSSEQLSSIVVSPAHFDALVKLLNELNKETQSERIIINNSLITQESPSGVIISSDVSSIFNDSKITFDIVNPSLYISLFNEFRGDSDISIYDDDDNSQYVISNCELEFYLPKQQKSSLVEIVFPKVNSLTCIDTLVITNAVRKTIKNISKQTEYMELLVYDDKLKCICVPDTAMYVFENYRDEFKTDKSIHDASLRLRISDFLSVNADEYTLYILKSEDDKYYFMADCSVSGVIPVRILDTCDVSVSTDILI